MTYTPTQIDETIQRELGPDYMCAKLGRYYVIVRKDRRPISDHPMQSWSLPKAIQMVKNVVGEKA
jgi:hypothetical protein